MNETKDKQPAGEILYGRFRGIADGSGCATYSWSGMTENYRVAWQRLAVALIRKEAAKEGAEVEPSEQNDIAN